MMPSTMQMIALPGITSLFLPGGSRMPRWSLTKIATPPLVPLVELFDWVAWLQRDFHPFDLAQRWARATLLPLRWCSWARTMCALVSVSLFFSGFQPVVLDVSMIALGSGLSLRH